MSGVSVDSSALLHEGQTKKSGTTTAVGVRHGRRPSCERSAEVSIIIIIIIIIIDAEIKVTLSQ